MLKFSGVGESSCAYPSFKIIACYTTINLKLRLHRLVIFPQDETTYNEFILAYMCKTVNHDDITNIFWKFGATYWICTLGLLVWEYLFQNLGRYFPLISSPVYPNPRSMGGSCCGWCLDGWPSLKYFNFIPLKNPYTHSFPKHYKNFLEKNHPLAWGTKIYVAQ